MSALIAFGTSIAGGLVGGVFGFAGTRHFYEKSQEKKKRKLRIALKAELKGINEQLANWLKVFERINSIGSSDENTLYVPNPSCIQNIIYETNAGELGLLSFDEVKILASFYSKAIQERDLIKTYVSTPEALPGSQQRTRNMIIDRLKSLFKDSEEAINVLTNQLK